LIIKNYAIILIYVPQFKTIISGYQDNKISILIYWHMKSIQLIPLLIDPALSI